MECCRTTLRDVRIIRKSHSENKARLRGENNSTPRSKFSTLYSWKHRRVELSKKKSTSNAGLRFTRWRVCELMETRNCGRIFHFARWSATQITFIFHLHRPAAIHNLQLRRSFAPSAATKS